MIPTGGLLSHCLPMKMPALSIVIPVYNEEGALVETIERLEKVLSRLPEGSEAIFVDDGSTDGSAAVFDQLATEETAVSLRLVRHRKNRGYGASLKTGIRAARNEIIAITDADGTYPVEKIPGFLKKMVTEEAAMVVGARSVDQQPAVRRPAKWVLRMLAQYLSGEKIPDMNSGLRVFTKKDAMRLRNILPDGFSFTTTITMSLLTEGQHVIFTPIRYEIRVGNSKIRPIYDTANFALLICRTSLAFNPMKVFGPVGAGLIALGTFLLASRVLFAQSFGVATTITLLMGGLQVLAIGLLADLVNRRSVSWDDKSSGE